MFLTEEDEEVLFGGAAGGGKSAAILAAALQFATVPGYSALLLRRTFADLYQPGALIPMSHEWLQGTKARWDAKANRWHFPGGSTLSFGYLDTALDMYRYQGAQYQFVGFDELTQFARDGYLYLFSRLRRLAGVDVPLRMRATSNPGGVGHDWVKQRFMVEHRPFIRSMLEQNPSLDRAAYESSLNRLDPVTRAQLRYGDWDVRPEGNLFKRGWFQTIDADRVPPLEDAVRCWDLAATTEEEGDDPDWLAGVKIGRVGRTYYVLHATRDRLTPDGVAKVITRTASVDSARVKIRVEQEGAASGKIVRSYYTRLLDGYDARFTGIPRSSKANRAGPFSAACERGDVKLVRGAWNEPFLDELCAFPQEGVHDDQVDAASGAYTALSAGVREWGGSELATVFAPGPLNRPAPKTPRDLLMEKLAG